MRSLVALDSHDFATVVCPWCGRGAPRSSFGFKVLRDDEVVGLLACSASDELGGFYPQSSVVITQLWVSPEHVGELVGSQLVQKVAAVVAPERVRYLVSGGTHGVPDCRHLPAGFLDAVGFVESVPGVQWRLDLWRTTWVARAARQVMGWVERLWPGRRPAPAGRSIHDPSE